MRVIMRNMRKSKKKIKGKTDVVGLNGLGIPFLTVIGCVGMTMLWQHIDKAYLTTHVPLRD